MKTIRRKIIFAMGFLLMKNPEIKNFKKTTRTPEEKVKYNEPLYNFIVG